MKSAILLTLGLLLVLVFPTVTSAHSKLETSIPAADSKLTESVSEVSLSFNENIDETLSTLKVLDQEGTEVEVSSVQVEGQTLSGTLASPLSSGAYTVEWKIVGGDGHPVDGTYAFEVDAPDLAPDAADPEEPVTDTDDAAEEPTSTDDTVTDDADNASAENEQDQDNAAAEPAENSGSTAWIIIIIVVAFVAGYFGIKASRKRK
ncbi:copper resistance CopC family protein [Paenibacillus sp. JCM 10914]|uniref:copper resistance CopC family protein n=1 Tax=Paenibacillus sp. JCM 10914 TaxID=1236974 RepID=UPI001E4E37BF|nr:copper resistance CopC family protein [Paenibacillus sp. JCM 10914]